MRAPPAPPLTADPAGAGAGVAPEEPTFSFPPRCWWLRRLLLGGLLLLLGVAGLRGWWGWRSHRLLQAYLSDLKSRGEPVTADDLNPPADVPPSANAALPLIRAWGSINFNSGSGPSNSNTVTFPAAWPFDATWDQMAGQAVAAHAKVFPLVRQARSMPQSDMGVRVRTPAVNTLLPHLNSVRALANLVSDAALWAHFHGDDAAAIETIRDTRALGPITDQPAVLVSHLVDIGIDAMALYKLQVMAPELDVAPEVVAPEGGAPAVATVGAKPPRRPASRRQIRELIAELLNDTERNAGLHRAVGAERVLEIDTTQWAAQNLWLLRPMFETDVLRMGRNTGQVARAAAQPNWPAAAAVLAPAPPAGPPAPATVMSNILSFSGNLAVQREFRIRAERRMAAVALAVRLYRLDHDGRWPASLQALVPAYLPSVPLDPFAPGGKTPLGYVILKGALPDGSDRPLVYHVDENARDDTAGKPAPPVPAVPCYSWTPKVPDQWRDLKRWMPPAPPATTQPATGP